MLPDHSIKVKTRAMDARRVRGTRSDLLIQTDQALEVLPQNGHAHGQVKPIDQMLAKRMQVLLHPADILTAIRHEHHLLILLHPLRLHQLP